MTKYIRIIIFKVAHNTIVGLNFPLLTSTIELFLYLHLSIYILFISQDYFCYTNILFSSIASMYSVILVIIPGYLDKIIERTWKIHFISSR